MALPDLKLKFCITKEHAKPGDAVVKVLNSPVDPENLPLLAAYYQRQLPAGVQLVLLNPGGQLIGVHETEKCNDGTTG